MDQIVIFLPPMDIRTIKSDLLNDSSIKIRRTHMKRNQSSAATSTNNKFKLARLELLDNDTYEIEISKNRNKS